jgi:hypothetical protein
VQSPVVHLRFAGLRDVALQLKCPIVVDSSVQPVHAALPLRCSACDEWCQSEGAVVLTYVDDDHYAYTDFGYEACLACACKSCGTSLRVTLGFTLTRHRGDRRHSQLEWDSIEGSAEWCPPT